MARCPNCGSDRVVVDGDVCEELTHPDRGPGREYYLSWCRCEECDHIWDDGEANATRYARAARLLAHRLTLKGDAAFAATVLSEAGIDATALVQREAVGHD